jgi:hypothetical protein
MTRACRSSSESGQASVELVAMLPLAALVALATWQLAVAGYALWAAGGAARSAARAAAVGADAGVAARRALPRRLERGLVVRRVKDGGVSVRVAVPLVTGGGALTHVVERARLQPQGAGL